MKTILTLFLIAFTSISSAQSITANLGAVECNYTILSYGYDLEVKKQHLIERSVAILKVSETDNSSYGAGLGYTEWHLEFVTGKKLESRDRDSDNEDKSVRGRYEVQFLDQDKGLLFESFVGSDKLSIWTGGTSVNPIYTYSLNLLGFPRVLLDDVKFVEITLIDF